MSEAEEKRNKGAGGDESVPTASFSGSEDGPGGKIGPYKLLSILGEGGFGIVYLAERQRPVRRRVALKVIKPGMDSKQVIARFETERQALALLDHPNIAQVFDAGTTKARRPYFVMEYVKGVPLTEHCDRQKLSIEERLELFLQVCDAVQHAHQKGIIHRDIKPSNILVAIEGEKAVPKIIDFGVAKAITQPLTERTLYTEQGQLIGTPEYMSPEQAEMTAQGIDTRSDIYSLGVMLYELLTGVLPFDRKTLERAGFSEIQRIIREEEPPRPSTKLTSLGEEAEKVAKSRRTEVATLAKRLHKELEWIPLKAMRKELTHRYRSAADLADDIQNYLNGEPLMAGPESAVYRVRKFVRRNRVSVTAAAAVAAAIIVGFVVSTTMYLQAEQAREKEASAHDEAERQAKISWAVLDFLTNDLLASVDPEKAKGREVTVREVLDAASEKIEGKFEDTPLVEAYIRRTLGDTYRNLGKYEAAEPHLEGALEIRQEQLGEEHTGTLRAMNALGLLYRKKGRYDEAEPLLVKALQTSRRVLGEEHDSTLRSMNHLASLYWDQGRYDEAEPLYIKVLEIGRRVLGEEHRDTLGSMGNLASLYQDQGRYDEAEALLVKVLESSRRILGEEHPNTLAFMMNLAVLYSEQGRYEEAEPLYVKVVEGMRHVLGEEHPDTLTSMHNLASLYDNQGRYDEAEPLYVKALEMRRRVLGEEHPDTLNSMSNLAALYYTKRQYEEAEPLAVKALEVSSRVLGEEHPDTLSSMHNLAALYHTKRQYDDAEVLYIKALEGKRRVLGEEHPDTLRSMGNLASLYLGQMRYDEAEPLLVEVLEFKRRVLGEEDEDTLECMNNLAMLYLRQTRYDEAEPLLVKVLECRRRVLGKEHPDTLVSMNSLSALYGNQVWHKVCSGDYIEAIETATKACELTEWKNAGDLDTLAAAYAEAGDFDSAVRCQREVIDLLPEEQRPRYQAKFEARLKLYQSGKLYYSDVERMVGWWKFDEGSGTISSDSAGENNGTIHGAEWTTGQVGGALDFDGTDDYVDLGYIGDFAAVTISLWVNIDSLPNIFNSLLHCDGWDRGDVHFMIPNDGCVRFSVGGSLPSDTKLLYEKLSKGLPGGVTDQDSSYAFTSDDFGQWHHIAAVYDSIEKTLDFYIDGQLDVQRSYSSTSAVRLGPARIAGWNSPPGDPYAERYFKGRIDDVRIYNYALSEAEVAAIYAGKEPSPVDKAEQAKEWRAKLAVKEGTEEQ